MRGSQARSAAMHISCLKKVEKMTRLSRLPLRHLNLLLMANRVYDGTIPGLWLGDLSEVTLSMTRSSDFSIS